MEYTLFEKKGIIKWYYRNHSVREIIDLFEEEFGNRPSTSTISRIIHNFESLGCLTPVLHKHPKIQKPARDPNEERNTLICASFLENPKQSTRELGSQFNISHTSVANVLRKYKYKQEGKKGSKNQESGSRKTKKSKTKKQLKAFEENLEMKINEIEQQNIQGEGFLPTSDLEMKMQMKFKEMKPPSL